MAQNYIHPKFTKPAMATIDVDSVFNEYKNERAPLADAIRDLRILVEDARAISHEPWFKNAAIIYNGNNGVMVADFANAIRDQAYIYMDDFEQPNTEKERKIIHQLDDIANQCQKIMDISGYYLHTKPNLAQIINFLKITLGRTGGVIGQRIIGLDNYFQSLFDRDILDSDMYFCYYPKNTDDCEDIIILLNSLEATLGNVWIATAKYNKEHADAISLLIQDVRMLIIHVKDRYEKE